jgi:hypothetical protein
MRVLSWACLAALLACRREAPSVELAAATPPAPPPAQAAPSAASDAPFAFTASDLDAYERGMRKEIELVKAARARESAAKTPEERGAAIQAGWETATVPEAARAIGADPDRYAKTRRTVGRVLETLDFQGKIPGPMEMNMELATPEMKRRLESDPFAELDPSSAAALKARMDRLVPIWIEYTELTAVSG